MEFTKNPNSPYDFELSMSFLAKENSEPAPYQWKDQKFRQAFRLGENVFPAKVESIGTVKEPELEVTTTDSAPKTLLKEKLTQFLKLDLDLADLYEFMERDPKLRRIKERFYGFKAPAMGSNLFQVIITAIVQQQISLQVAYHMTSLLVKKFGESVDFQNEKYWAFPSPNSLAEARIEELRSCKLSERKSEYIKDFSRAVREDRLQPEDLRGMETEEIVDMLTEYRGIGTWTAELVSVAASRNKGGKGPAADLGVRDAVSKYYFDGERQDPETVREILSRWNEYAKDVIVYLLYATRRELEV
ncbi:hypothetical protein AKJ41_03305 [candidate division MSBL1 archaeon SCGC-AAA259O05]|uniref:HhH-GPD domain-containing protein n=1 Tax=candidate division MSBL1 archaeon SCGC-AAA259O05 TaxID=1698271 RepID=A0A133V3E7_9EURY|nr:hypothetical protein AKJ41_03305 [candidate division MSBL1 archaeon SCGC-AAA259O05]